MNLNVVRTKCAFKLVNEPKLCATLVSNTVQDAEKRAFAQKFDMLNQWRRNKSESRYTVEWRTPVRPVDEVRAPSRLGSTSNNPL